MSFCSHATPDFWACYDELPTYVRELADAKYALFERDPFHPSLGFQQKGAVWTVEIGRSYRAIAVRRGNDLHWFWIGSHEAYNGLLRRLR